MKSIEGVGLAEVVSLYGGVQGDFMQLVFGQQIHIGGMKASMELAERAGIGRGLRWNRSMLLQRRRNALPRALSKRRLDGWS